MTSETLDVCAFDRQHGQTNRGLIWAGISSGCAGKRQRKGKILQVESKGLKFQETCKKSPKGNDRGR